MADILQITTPITPKDYQMPNYRDSHASDRAVEQNFDLGDQTKIIKTNDRTHDYNEQNLKDSSNLRLPSQTLGMGSVSSSLNVAKELFSSATMAALSERGDVDTLNKVTEFAQEIILSPEDVAQDMINQQANSTVYSGDMWNALRELSKLGSENLNEAILDFAKAVANNSEKDEILSSLSANLKYLANELAPSKAVSEELMNASQALSGQDAQRNFSAIKGTLVQLVNYTSESLLLDNKSQNLLPLIIYNMSRYNDDPSALRDSFDTIMKIFDNEALSSSQLSTLAQMTGAEGESAADVRSALEGLFDSFIIKQDLPTDVKNSSFFSSETLEEQNHLDSMTNMLSLGIKSMSERIDIPRLQNTLSGIDRQSGSQAVRLALASLTPNTTAMADALNDIIDNFDKTGDLQSLINRLGQVINSIDNMDVKMPLAQTLNESLMVLAGEQGVNYTPPTSMENLADFLVKNIDDKSLQSLVSANQTDMLRNVLTAPGVFNPLIHVFAPMDAFGMRAFAEIWVDRNAENIMRDMRDIADEEETSHVFMCFDMEDVGYFELEMYAKQNNLSVMLLCPEGTENDYSTLKQAVPRIAAASGYTVGTTIVDTLYQKRNLSRVFPKLNETRSGLNAQA